MTGVIYARYSTDNQREESIEGQIRECTAYAEKHGITIVKHYIDRAYSAKTDNRPKFQLMIADSVNRLFDVVIVWKLDRFARNRYDSARYKVQLKKYGVKVISATETISEGADGILIESVLEGYAEYYSADLSEKVIRGLTENAIHGKHNGGTLPIGYVLDEDHFFQIDPLTAPMVLEVFKLYDEGSTMKQIVDAMNAKGLKNTKGSPMNYNSIERMLKNRRYIGELTYRSIFNPNAIPAIIPKDLFDRVQEKMAKNKKAPARHKAEDEYLLTTKLFCGECGAMMYGECGTGRSGNSYHYYKCQTVKKHNGKCSKKPVRKQWIEDLVVAEAKKVIMSDETLERIVCMMLEMQEQENTVIPVLEKQLRDVNKSISNLVKAIEQGIFTRATKERMDELEADRVELETQLACEKLAKPKVTREQATFWLMRFRVLDFTQKEHRQQLIDTFVNSVFLYDDRLLISFNFKDGTAVVGFDTALKAKKTNGSDISASCSP